MNKKFNNRSILRLLSEECPFLAKTVWTTILTLTLTLTQDSYRTLTLALTLTLKFRNFSINLFDNLITRLTIFLSLSNPSFV